MEIKSKIAFADMKLKEAYLELDNSSSEGADIKRWLNKAFEELEKNAFVGIQIPKRLIPKTYSVKYGINNLWKYDLPGAWRLIYSIQRNEIVVLSIILEWMNHKDYERRFGY